MNKSVIKNVYVKHGISFGGLLTIVLLALKLTGHITISWLWVFAPLLWPVYLILGIVGVALFFTIFAFLAEGDKIFGKRR